MIIVGGWEPIITRLPCKHQTSSNKLQVFIAIDFFVHQQSKKITGWHCQADSSPLIQQEENDESDSRGKVIDRKKMTLFVLMMFISFFIDTCGIYTNTNNFHSKNKNVLHPYRI